MSANTDPPIVKLEDVPWRLDGADGSSTFGDSPPPTSGNDDLVIGNKRYSIRDLPSGNDEVEAILQLAVLLAEAGDEYPHIYAKLESAVRKQAAQIAELQAQLICIHDWDVDGLARTCSKCGLYEVAMGAAGKGTTAQTSADQTPATLAVAPKAQTP